MAKIDIRENRAETPERRKCIEEGDQPGSGRGGRGDQDGDTGGT